MTILAFLNQFCGEARRRNPFLFYLAMGLFFMFFLFLATYRFCGNPPVAEICYWLKPFKFSLSFGLYVLVLAWIMEYLIPTLGAKQIKLLSLLVGGLILIEMGTLLLQSLQFSSAYGSLHISEKNTGALSAFLRLAGNGIILLSTAVAAYIGAQFFRKMDLGPPGYLLGIRAGFVLLFISCLIGAFLLVHYGEVPPDHHSLGLPFSRLASPRSRLLSLHFVGIHALQFFPLIGFYFTEWVAKPLIFASLLVFVFLTATSLPL